jgi:hypothetical protein
MPAMNEIVQSLADIERELWELCMLIEDFELACHDSEHTDTDDVWELLYHIRNTLEKYVGKGWRWLGRILREEHGKED